MATHARVAVLGAAAISGGAGPICGSPNFSATDADAIERHRCNLIHRAWKQRQTRRMRQVLVDCGRVYFCLSEIDPWGTKFRVSWERLEAEVETAECASGFEGVERKPAASAGLEPSPMHSLSESA